MTTPARALYVHVPFCRTLCGYCDFYSTRVRAAQVTPLVDALLAELRCWSDARPFRFDTIYVGGGTPTTLPADELERLLAGLAAHRDPAADIEFTVEANPATVTPARAAALARCGVNRVSLGAQSFEPRELRRLDRRHRPEQVAETAALCRAAGLTRLSLDLLFGVPGQTRASWARSLAAALALDPEHLSCYGLTYEEGTPLTARRDAGRLQPLDEDTEADQYEYAMDALAAAGRPQYELSNYARPGCECRHNLRYWHNEPYLGLGPSAAGFIDEVRYKNVADTAAYVAAIRAGRSARVAEERLPPERRAGETAMLELRLVEGIDRRRFAARFGTDPADLFAAAIARHAATGLLELDERGVRLTRAGRLLANRVIVDFV